MARIQFCSYFLLTLMFLLTVCYGIPLDEFFPFGDNVGDSKFPPNDDNSIAIQLNVGFTFYNQTYQTIFLNNNGDISFNEPLSGYTPDEFPLVDSVPVIAPYWADVDTRGTGSVSYRLTTDPEIILRVRNEIAVAFPQLSTSFIAQEVVVATWDRVGYFNMQTNLTNTFQCILATDGVFSFALFLYADGGIQWTTGDASDGVGGFGGTPAQAGFDSGNGVDFTVINGSFSDNIVNIDKISNVDVPGKFAFQVNGRIQSGSECDESITGSYSISPNYGNQLGGTPIIITGLCFDETSSITCRFGEIETPCVRVSNREALCISPKLDVKGRIPIKVMVGNVSYEDDSVTFSSQHYSDLADVSITTNGSDLIISANNILGINWFPSTIFPMTDSDNIFMIDISLQEADAEFNGSILPLSWTINRVLKPSLSNNGNTNVLLPDLSQRDDGITLPLPFMSPYSLAFIKVSVNTSSIQSNNDTYLNALKKLIQLGSDSPSKWSHVLFRKTETKPDEESCSQWISETLDTIRTDLDACPCNILLAELPLSGFDQRTTPGKRIIDRFLHGLRTICYVPRALNSSLYSSQTSGILNPSQECCYDEYGNLIVDAPFGGSADAQSSHFSWEFHYLFDISTYLVCCVGSNSRCMEYYNKRPSDNCSNFQLGAAGWIFGDPHFLTLDGLQYTFNGRGEFILIDTFDNRFQLQGRMVPAKNVDGGDSLATVFSAIVAKQNDSDTIEFRSTPIGIQLLVNGLVVELGSPLPEEFNNVIVSIREVDIFGGEERASTLGAVFTSGVYVEVKQDNGFLCVITASLHPVYIDSTRGLLGVYNKDLNDDLLPRNTSIPLPLNSTWETIHYYFGLTWIIRNESASLFTYPPSAGFEFYYYPGYTPLFEAVFSNSTLQEEAEEICGSDDRCLFDIAVTGRIEIGICSIEQVEFIDNVTHLSLPIVCNPSCFRGACVANDTCNCPFGYDGDFCQNEVFTDCGSGNPCKNGGNCTQHVFTIICECESQYTGENCQNLVVCNPSCVRGACVANDTCDCPFGYDGNLCENKVLTDCGSDNPCKNGGNCTRNSSTIICECESQYTGEYCQNLVVCNPSCVRGACVANDTCNCPFGYDGNLCENEVLTDCGSDNPCKNGGNCTRNSSTIICECESQYTGEYCQNLDDDNVIPIIVGSVIGGVLLILLIIIIIIIIAVVIAVYRRYHFKDEMNTKKQVELNEL